MKKPFGLVVTQRLSPGCSAASRGLNQACRYLVKDFGTSEPPKSTRQRDSRYAPTVLRPPRFRIAHCSRA
ncbi:MAG: hypothetical protein KZQ65_01185, partial [Candidatus Thiodiazotropha sp. (ex Gloverina cf. vestifex)]|nr:hypothetical protein [Candidatus Thiodiazotropha sp. (ex Gloverina cf. vestifex)]